MVVKEAVCVLVDPEARKYSNCLTHTALMIRNVRETEDVTKKESGGNERKSEVTEMFCVATDVCMPSCLAPPNVFTLRVLRSDGISL